MGVSRMLVGTCCFFYLFSLSPACALQSSRAKQYFGFDISQLMNTAKLPAHNDLVQHVRSSYIATTNLKCLALKSRRGETPLRNMLCGSPNVGALNLIVIRLYCWSGSPPFPSSVASLACAGCVKPHVSRFANNRTKREKARRE